MPARQFPFRPHLDRYATRRRICCATSARGRVGARRLPRVPSRADRSRDRGARGRAARARSQLRGVELAAARRGRQGDRRHFARRLRGTARRRRGAPDLARDRDRPRDGWHAPLADAADAAIRRVMMRLRERGVHSADGLLARLDLQPVLDTLRLLGRLGGSPAGDWVGGSVEVLRGSDFALLVEFGADARDDWDGTRWRSRRTREIRQASIASSR